MKRLVFKNIGLFSRNRKPFLDLCFRKTDRYIGLKPFGEDQIAAGRLFPEMKT